MVDRGDTFLNGGHSVHVAVAEFHDSVIKLACLLDLPTLDQIYLRNVTRCVSQMFLLILCL